MRFKSAVSALALVGASTLGAVTTTSTPALAASCPDNGYTVNKDGDLGKYFNSNNVNIRTGPSTACTSVAQGQMWHTIIFDCYKYGDGGTWTHIWDISLNKGGWVKDTLLVGNGSGVRC